MVFLDSVVGKMVGDIIEMRYILFALSLVAVISVPVYATWLYIDYKLRRHKLEDKSLSYHEKELRLKVIKSSSDRFEFNSWKNPARTATKVVQNAKRGPSNSVLTRRPLVEKKKSWTNSSHGTYQLIETEPSISMSVTVSN